MRFVATICHQNNILARVSIDDDANETLSQNALRGRNTLIRNANRQRSDKLSDNVLDQMAEIYSGVIASQIITGESSFVTCVARGENISRMNGQVATLTGPNDLVMLVESKDNKWIADTDRFLDQMLSKTA